MHSENSLAAIELSEAEKTYGVGASNVRALRGVSAVFTKGSFTTIMGPSGSGKSTFLQCAAGLERLTSGSVSIMGQEISKLSEEELTLLRRSRIGFIFQAFNLVPSLTAAQNIELILRLGGKPRSKDLIQEALDQVGLKERARHLPSQLSGGQQQRVAIARALASQPEVLFADEPTGALDSITSKEVMKLIRELVDTKKQTVVMVTHDPNVAAYADKVLLLADGTLRGILEAPSSEVIAQRMASLEA